MKHLASTNIFRSIIASAVLVAAFCCLFRFISFGRETELPQQVDTIFLNKTITNESFEDNEAIDRKVRAYMRRWEIKGCQLTISDADTLRYAKAYGNADGDTEMTPGHIMRVASVSKLITAAAVMKLQEEGLVSLRDTVFGPRGLLDGNLYTACTGKKAGFGSITVEHLLRHQAGFRRDPMFGIQNLMTETHSSEPLSHDYIVRLGLSSTLRFAPGTWQRYSNFGYFLLSDIIEKCSGMPYEEYVRTRLLEPAGCYDMHIGGTWYKDRFPNEVRYHVQEGPGKYIPDYRDTTRMTERCYGGNDMKMLGAAGGWVASAVELSQFVASIDGDEAVPDILCPESVRAMTEYIDENSYSLGWNDTNPDKGWQRSGTLAGTSSLIYRFPDGQCWILLMNSGTAIGPRQAKLTEALFRDCKSIL